MDNSYQALLKKHTYNLLSLNHVVGVGYGKKIKDSRKTDEDSIIVMVDRKLPESELKKKDVIPEKLEDFKTDVQEIGILKLLEVTLPRKQRYRPAPGGVSIGHYKITAGTLGAIVKDNKTGEPLILSNNHVLANISNGKDGRANIGDPILQPGSYDNGNQEKDLIGNLFRFVPLEPNKNIFNPVSNIVDCALAKPVDKNAIEDYILEIGKVNEVKEPEVDMKVIKSGRTTGLTEANIKAIDSTVVVNLDAQREAIFTDQIVADCFSEGGDSGSLVLDKDNNAVGLLFAGSDKATICNKITNVMKELDIDFYRNINKDEKTGRKEEKKKEREQKTKYKASKVNNINTIIFLAFVFLLSRYKF